MVKSVLGPMSISLDGLTTFYRAVLSSRPWLRDPLCPRMPWSEDAYNLEEHGATAAMLQDGFDSAGKAGEGVPKLCFGIMWDNGASCPTPPVSRAMRMVKDALEEMGHEVRDWEAGDMKEAGRLLVRCLSYLPHS